MTDRQPTPLILWVDHGSEGWRPTPCDTSTLVERIAEAYSSRFVVTPPPLDTMPYGPVAIPVPEGFGR